MQRGRNGFGGRPPKGVIPAVGGLLLLGGGAVVFSNSLFNGRGRNLYSSYLPLFCFPFVQSSELFVPRLLTSIQSMEVTEQSNTQDLAE